MGNTKTVVFCDVVPCYLEDRY